MDWLRILFFLKHKTAYELRISDWSSDVCSSDLSPGASSPSTMRRSICFSRALVSDTVFTTVRSSSGCVRLSSIGFTRGYVEDCRQSISPLCLGKAIVGAQKRLRAPPRGRSEEHTSELQSLMRNSYAVFCLK